MLYQLKVRRLHVVNTPIKAIEQYTFLGINRTLQELHVINSELQHYPAQAFEVQASLFHKLFALRNVLIINNLEFRSHFF